MAKFYSSTFGAISGKHGNAVAVTRKDGTTYIRIYTKPSNPKTDKQQAHRAKFALSSKALVPFNPIFKDTIGITNGISTARSYAFKNAIVGEYPNLSVDYEKLIFSFGPLAKLHNASATSNKGIVTINWDFQKMYNCTSDDRVSLVVFNKERNQAIHIKDVALRSEKISKIDIQDAWADSELYFWAYVTSGDKISDSVFVGKCSPSDMVSSCSEEVEDQDSCAYKASDELDIRGEEMKYECNANRLDVNRIIVNFMTVLLNLISLFKQSVNVNNIQGFVNQLKHSAVGIVGYMGITNIKREFSAYLICARRSVLEELYVKYCNMITLSRLALGRQVVNT